MPNEMPWHWFVPYLLIIGVFYFLVIRPNKDEREKRKQQLANIKKNDHVVTASGIHGTVVNIKDTTIIVRIDDNARMEVDKEAITTIKSQ